MAATTEHFPGHIPPKANALVQTLLDPHVQDAQLSQEVGIWLGREDLKRLVGEIDPEDQKRLIDRIGQVCFKTVSPFFLSPVHTGHI